MKWAILLTTCWRTTRPDDQKRAYYIKAISDWLTKTDFPIYVVESSGRGFPEFAGSRLRVCVCDLVYNKKANLNLDFASSSQYEARSILTAMNQYADELREYTHVMKITGRYYVYLQHVLPALGDADIILQHRFNHGRRWNNSEVFGFRIGAEKEFLNWINPPALGYMEEAIYKYAQTHKYGRLPPLTNINRAASGGSGKIIDPL
jgi:hypothetical protein